MYLCLCDNSKARPVATSKKQKDIVLLGSKNQNTCVKVLDMGSWDKVYVDKCKIFIGSCPGDWDVVHL